VGTAGDGAAALRLIAERQPDVLLLDVHLPGLSGVEVARQTRARFPRVAILVLTGYDDLGDARALVRLGVQGYLPKTASGEQIVAAIRTVARGETVLISKAAQAALGRGVGPLTAREDEVLRLLAAGKRNAEIAAALAVSVSTVEFHLSNLFQKLGATSRTEAIRLAREQGLTPPARPEPGEG
jgi:DNA-binding NarL/FixJ family response regulator